MLFIVPDETDSSESAAAAPESAQEAAASASAPKVDSFKVELDLDDAPFLDDEPAPEPEAPVETPADTPAVAMPEAEPPKKGIAALRAKLAAFVAKLRERLPASKKKLIIAGGAGALLLVAAIVVNVFLFGGSKKPETPPPAPAAAAAPEIQRIVISSNGTQNTPVPPPFAYLLKLDPFWVEKRGTQGEIRFLTCTLVLATNDPVLNSEFIAKVLTLRDSLYYYLKNRPLALIDDPAKARALREDLISVVNEHVSSGKLTEIYIEDYLVTTP